MAVTFNPNGRSDFRAELMKRAKSEERANKKRREADQAIRDASRQRKAPPSAQERFEHYTAKLNDPTCTGAEARVAFREQQKAKLELQNQ